MECHKLKRRQRAKEKYATDSEHRAKVISKVSKYGSQNVESRRERSNKSYAKNKEKYKSYKSAYGAIRRRRVCEAKPPWVSWKDIKVVYDQAAKLGLTVDHIIPLRHNSVCGLHVPWNMQLITMEENTMKGNKFDVS